MGKQDKEIWLIKLQGHKETAQNLGLNPYPTSPDNTQVLGDSWEAVFLKSPKGTTQLVLEEQQERKQ